MDHDVSSDGPTMAERLNITRVLTLDRRDFQIDPSKAL